MNSLNCLVGATTYGWDLDNKTGLINEDVVKYTFPDGRNVLMFALINNCYSENFILQLIDAGSSINSRSDKGRTPLMYALHFGHRLSIIDKLLKSGADVNIRCEKGMTALMYALKSCYNKNTIYKLIDAGSILNVTCINGKNALIYAIENKYEIDVIEKLVNQCGDLNYDIRDGMTPFGYALRCRSKPEILKLMIDCGAKVNMLNHYRNNMNVFMYFTCDNDCSMYNCNYKESIYVLLNNGVDIKIIDEAGCTVLHYVCCKYLISLAIKRGVSIESACRKGYTPLICAVINNDEVKVKFLLSLSANPNCVDYSLKTPLHHFIKRRFCYEIVNHLVYYGADLLAQDNCGNTPIHAFYFLCEIQFDEFFKTQVFKCHSHFIANVLLFFNDLNKHDSLGISNDSESSPYSLLSYLYGFYLELCKMKTIYIKKGLTFYDFSIAKKLYRSKCIDISCNEYKYNLSDVRFMFPNFYTLIILRIKCNHRQNVRKLLLRSLENIFISPFKIDNNTFHSRLPYDCFHAVCEYLSTTHLYNLFTASVKI